MDELALSKWNQRYRGGGDERPVPATVLREHRHLLAESGEALDVACGLGGNAIELARLGYSVAAWDIADAAIERLSVQADNRDLAIKPLQRDVVAQPPAAGSFDLIVVSRFLDRGLCPALAAALKPGGLLMYQTFVRDKPPGAGPSNPDFLLAPNELLSLFSSLQVLSYQEQPGQAEAWLVAAKS